MAYLLVIDHTKQYINSTQAIYGQTPVEDIVIHYRGILPLS